MGISFSVKSGEELSVSLFKGLVYIFFHSHICFAFLGLLSFKSCLAIVSFSRKRKNNEIATTRNHQKENGILFTEIYLIRVNNENCKKIGK